MTPETQKLQFHTPLLRACALPRLPLPPFAIAHKAEKANEETEAPRRTAATQGQGPLPQEKGGASSGGREEGKRPLSLLPT